MKIVAFILCCYMLMLTTIPCADKMERNDLPAIAQAANSHEGHQHSGDQCPPICHCTCCSISICEVKPATFELENIDWHPAKQPTNHIPYFSQSCLSDIWQPPKLVV
jgi:hypothetical protein